MVGVVCTGAGANECLPAGQPADDHAERAGRRPVGPRRGRPDARRGRCWARARDVRTWRPPLGALPEGVELLDITPVSVSVTIRAPAAPSPTPAP